MSNPRSAFALAALALLVSACKFNPHSGFSWPYNWPPAEPPAYTNDKGEYVVDPRFQYIGRFHANGLARVSEKGHWQDRRYVNLEGKPPRYGYINRKGEIVIEPKFESLNEFYDGLAAAQEGGKWGIINEKGEYVIPPKFVSPLYFKAHDLADASTDGAKWGYINRKGEFVIEPKFDQTYLFSADGFAQVVLNGKYGYINTKGVYVVEPRFDDYRDADSALRRLESHYSGDGISFNKLPVDLSPALSPTTPDSPRIFAGEGSKIEVRFRTYSEAQSADIDSFPEPPVTVLNATEKTRCTIGGGNWARKDIYLSADERYLILGEFNAASDALVSYDTKTCREIKRLDVSGKRWDLQGSAMILGSNCTGAWIEDCKSMLGINLRIFLPKHD